MEWIGYISCCSESQGKTHCQVFSRCCDSLHCGFVFFFLIWKKFIIEEQDCIRTPFIIGVKLGHSMQQNLSENLSYEQCNFTQHCPSASFSLGPSITGVHWDLEEIFTGSMNTAEGDTSKMEKSLHKSECLSFSKHTFHKY